MKYFKMKIYINFIDIKENDVYLLIFICELKYKVLDLI